MTKLKKKLTAYLALMFISAFSAGCASPNVLIRGQIINPNKQDSMTCETERQLLTNNETIEKTGK